MVKSMKEIEIFRSKDEKISLEVQIENESVWLTQDQMALLFQVSRQNVSLHVNNCFREGELEENSVRKDFLRTASDGKKYKTKYYNLDVIISVGYRVKSKRGVEFRKWANTVLKDYILKGYAYNDSRMEQLGTMLKVLKRAEKSLDTGQVINVIEKYSKALDLLDSYDHNNMKRPQGTDSDYVLTYEECREVIDSMKFGAESDLFGKEKDDSFKGSIGNIYQTFGGEEVYPTIEEKAAHLLYFLVKNHSFFDGNKRIGASIFLYFLHKNGILFENDRKLLDDMTLVTLTLMVAESRPEEMEIMITVIMNCIK
ncbi:MAG: type II toxin-antitoxin system death-on-curing family toxin [Armatimonadetes bacterium]|nr:type II toxin-antitoxin system death-on-curing family toxin [Candidatus Hippobium faecium]